MKDDTCSAIAQGDRFVGPKRCSRRATVTRNGKGFCTQHDPERVRRKQQARHETYLEMREAENREAELCKAIRLKRSAIVAAACAIVEHDRKAEQGIESVRLVRLVRELRRLEEQVPRAKAEAEAAREEHRRLAGGKKRKR